MLLLDFLNVGDGDAMLLREQRPGAADFVALVDAGRPHIEFSKGSLRREAIAHLKKIGVDHIDLMVLTHLHFDHIGGALRILQHYPVKKLLAGYLPPADAKWIIPPSFEEKTIVGLCEALNMLCDIAAAMKRNGGQCELAERGTLALTNALRMEVKPAGAQLRNRQRDVFDALYRGENPGYERIYEASKDRNCSSVILRLSYSDRSVLLTGDSYGAYWEDRGEQHCDILKVPHHGDSKSMTPKLIETLKPGYAVISCQNDSSKKERPCPEIVACMQRHIPFVLCTENQALPGYEASSHESIRFYIHEDGRIDCLDQM